MASAENYPDADRHMAAARFPDIHIDPNLDFVQWLRWRKWIETARPETYARLQELERRQRVDQGEDVEPEQPQF